MSFIATHPLSAIERFESLADGVRAEFGEEGLMDNVERFITAKRPDLIWEGRLEVHYRGEWIGADMGGESLYYFLILSRLGDEFFVAYCAMDDNEELYFMGRHRAYRNRKTAEIAFKAATRR